MNNSFEYLDIILLAMIAGFIILRLRGTLGRRTGHEKKILGDSFFKKETQSNNGKKVVNLRIFINSLKNYFNPKYKPDYNLDANTCIKEIRNLLIQSLKLRIRSDVPIAFCLSGGIDSSSLVSIAAKELNCKFKNIMKY